MSLALAAMMFVAVGHSLAFATLKADPATARALAPWDRWFEAASARALTSSQIRPGSNTPAVREARDALGGEPLAVNALMVLGTQARLEGLPKRAAAIFSQASRLTRRNIEAQLWAIESAVDRGDIDGALAAYDIAFRTSSAAQTMLFPVLADAIAEPRVRAFLLDRLVANPPWSKDFIHYATRSVSRLEATRLLIGDMRQRGIRVNNADARELTNALFRAGNYDEAWREAYGGARAPSCHGIRQPAFGGPQTSPTVFDWQTSDDAAPFVSHASGSADPGLALDVPANNDVIVVQQVTRLCPGVSRLAGETDDLIIPVDAEVHWIISCIDGPELARIPVRGRANDRATYSATLSVPATCGMQRVELRAKAAGTEGISGRVLSFSATGERQ